MATSTTSAPKSAPKAEQKSLYELQLEQTPPPPTPTQAELDQIALGTYVTPGTIAPTAKPAGEAQEPGKR